MFNHHRIKIFAFFEHSQTFRPLGLYPLDPFELAYSRYLLVPYMLVHVQCTAIGVTGKLSGEIEKLIHT